MIEYCPFCGSLLDPPLADGISSCINCNRVFDSNPTTRVLSASWLVRRRHLLYAEEIERQGFTRLEAELVEKYVIEQHFSHQEFEKKLKEVDFLNDSV